MIEETILRLIEQLPLSIGVLIVMFWLGRRFLGIWEVQVRSRDAFLDKLLDRFSLLDNDTSEVKAGIVGLAQQMMMLQSSSEAFASRMDAAFTNMDSVLNGWQKTYTTVTDAIVEKQSSQSLELSALRSEVTEKMSKLEEGNHDIYNQLEAMGQRLESLTAVLEAAKLDEFATIPAAIHALMEEIKAAVGRVAADKAAGEAESNDKPEQDV